MGLFSEGVPGKARRKAQEGWVVMTENENRNGEKDIKTRYEFLIGGILAVVLCMSAFAIFMLANYFSSGAFSPEPTIAAIEDSAGTVVFEVEIRETIKETSESEGAPNDQDANEKPLINEHDDIHIFMSTPAGDNYYRSREGGLPLYVEPKATDEHRPELMEEAVFEVLGFSRDGWAAINYGGIMYYIKSADIVKTDAPDDAMEKHVDPVNSRKIRFFSPNSGDIEYVVKMNTRAFSLPDVMSSGNKIDLKEGERVIVVAMCENWYKIIYMNAEYYLISYLTPRDEFIADNPDVEIIDNTGYAPAGSPDAVLSASAAGASDKANSSGVTRIRITETEEISETSDTSSDPSDTSVTSDTSESSETSANNTDTADQVSANELARELLDLTNAERAKKGYAPLEWSDTLASCAEVRASELPLLSAEQNREHLRPNGQPWYTVNGYTEETSPMWAENIAYGQMTAREVFDAWMASKTYYDNMMNPDYKTFGAAVFVTESGYKFYWIEEFGF